jgi:S-adenosylmethionine decarboxylase proenzyme
MFAESHSSGKHMICDIRDVQNTSLLNDVEELKNMLKKICKKYDYSILGELNHVFTPQGCTILYLLSESHLSIHTFPEKKYLAFDLYTCRKYEDDTDYIKIYESLIEQLQASHESSYTILDRTFFHFL